MKLESQVTSLETSKKLKELGVKQNSLHWWARSREGVNVPLENCIWSEWELYNCYAEDVRIDDGETPREEVSISAFTASELAEMLPQELTLGEEDQPYADPERYLQITTWKGQWSVNYCIEYDEFSSAESLFEPSRWSNSLVEALAACLIYLLENKLITL